MAKGSKDADRRAVVERMRREQQRKERRQGLLLLGAAVTVGAIIIGVAVWQFVKADSGTGSGPDLSSIGVASEEAGCTSVQKKQPEDKDLDGIENSAHVDTGTPVDFRLTPPAFGLHWPNYLTGSELRSFYTVDDRPEVERLVHSLEHGYTILWYDETIAEDEEALDDIEEIAQRFPDPSSIDDHFIAAPWTAQDGEPMPDGAHLALTHWSIGGEGGNIEDETGVWQYCEGVSGDVVEQFRSDYPSLDAPEPGAA